MTSTVQLKLRGISIAGDLPEKWTQMNTDNVAGDIFTKVISAVRNFFHVAAPYLIAAAVLITCLCCFPCLFSCLSAIITGCFSMVLSFFRFLGRCLCCGGRSAGKMMRAPGRAAMWISRTAFEANPGGYFSGLRGNPSSFVF